MRLILRVTAIVFIVLGLGLALNVIVLFTQHVAIANLSGFLMGSLGLLTIAYFSGKWARRA